MAEIKVTIQDQTSSETVYSNSGVVNNNKQNPTKPVNTNTQQEKDNKKASVGAAVGVMIAKRTLNYATSNVGKWTGNSRNQTAINNVQTVIGYGMAMAINPFLGMTSIGLDIATTAIDNAYEHYWDKRTTKQAQARTGGKGGYRR